MLNFLFIDITTEKLRFFTLEVNYKIDYFKKVNWRF